MSLNSPLPVVPYTVFYYNNPTQPIDISQYVVSVSLKLQGTGRIRSASLMLDATEGQFITNSNNGATPIISAFDAIFIKWIDDNLNQKTAIVVVDQILKQITEQGKVQLPLELLGRERALRDMKTQAYFRFNTPHFVLETLRNRYNKSKGSSQPFWNFVDLLGNNFNNAPNNVNNVYDFSAGVTYYDAVMQIISRLNQPTSLGGAGDFFSLTFDDDPSGAIIMKVFVQGTTTGTIPTITDSEADPIHKITVQKNTPPGTQVLVRGTANTGTLPPDFHRYSSWVETINNYPTYNPAVTYSTGVIVNVGNVLYSALSFVPVNTPPPNATFWLAVTVSQIIGPLNYSLWTNNKATDTKNSCSNPDNAFGAAAFAAPAFPDGNLVIRDRIDPTTTTYKFFRDFAWVRAKSDADIIADPRMKQYLMGSNQDQFYNGFTVLVDTTLGAASGAFAGNDIFGSPFANSLVQFDGTEWIVIRIPAVGDQIAIYLEGKNYEFNVVVSQTNSKFFGNAQQSQALATPQIPYKFRGSTGTLAWRDISGTAGGNDCWHAPSNITNVTGLLPSNIKGQDYSSYVANSALQITYTYDLTSSIYTAGANLLQKIASTVTKFFRLGGTAQINNEYTLSVNEIALTLEAQYYNYGWWYALPFPYPFSTFNGIIEKVGDLYGGGSLTASDFAALDLQNGNYTHSGLTGYNNADVSDLGGPLTGIQFYFLFNILLNGQKQPFQGNLPFTVTIYDDQRNVWRADYTYRLLADPQLIQMYFSDFTLNRPSRIPFQIDTLPDIIDILAVPELQLQYIFDTKRVRLITIQWSQSYDENLRYMPVSVDSFIRNFEAGGFSGTVSFVGTIDGFGFIKAPFVSSGIVSDRVVNPDILEASNVRNYNQLKSIAIAEANLAGLPFEQFTVVRNLSCDLTLEQSVYLQNADLINETDQTNVPNTRKLILLTDEYSYDIINGALRTMTLTKRLGGP